ncbi:MAG: hypothetical protein KAG43_08405, partial [Candidatus Marithrix sp.]|nr:hypothetical protein [Candidatus Marithrix sp.]
SVTLTYPDGSTKIQLTATPEADDYAFVGWDGDDCEGNTETIIVKVGAKCEPIFALDSDQDGTADMIENAAPNDGDGNNDGIPDSQQNNVISLPTASGLYLTTAVNEDCKVNSVRLDSDTTTFDLNCAEATVTNYHHGINELEPTKVSGYVITNPSYLNGKSLVTEKFTMTVDEFGKGIHINSIFPGKVQLSSSSYVARETDQTAKITVLRKNGCDGQITVDYNTQSDTATANVDYLLKYGSLTWEDNDCSRKSFNITIFDDLDEEDTEIIQINLLSSEVTEPFSADLTIVDDDSLVVDSDETSEQDITFEPENIISTNGEQIIYLTVGQSKVFTVQEAMTFVKQLPDLQLVLVSNLKSFSNEDGELTLTGLSVGQTELTVSNRDYSKEVTVKIIVTTGAEEINYIIQPTQPISPSTQPIAKCDKPNAMAINSAGLYVNSDSCFISTLNNIKQSSVKRKISQAKQVRIIAQIYIDPQDIGKIAEILLVARYTDPQDKTVLYNRGNKIWQVWKEQFDSLLTAQNHPLLPEIVNIFVFEGKLSLAGEFTVFVGYRLENGTIIFNGLEPLNFIVEGE